MTSGRRRIANTVRIWPTNWIRIREVRRRGDHRAEIGQAGEHPQPADQEQRMVGEVGPWMGRREEPEEMARLGRGVRHRL